MNLQFFKNTKLYESIPPQTINCVHFHRCLVSTAKGMLFKYFMYCMHYVPVVVGHGSGLQRRPRVFVHANAAPLIFTIVTRVCDVQNFVTANPETRWVTMVTEVKVHAHVERVGAGERWRQEFSE